MKLEVDKISRRSLYIHTCLPTYLPKYLDVCNKSKTRANHFCVWDHIFWFGTRMHLHSMYVCVYIRSILLWLNILRRYSDSVRHQWTNSMYLQCPRGRSWVYCTGLQVTPTQCCASFMRGFWQVSHVNQSNMRETAIPERWWYRDKV